VQLYIYSWGDFAPAGGEFLFLPLKSTKGAGWYSAFWVWGTCRPASLSCHKDTRLNSFEFLMLGFELRKTQDGIKSFKC